MEYPPSPKWEVINTQRANLAGFQELVEQGWSPLRPNFRNMDDLVAFIGNNFGSPRLEEVHCGAVGQS
jgi:hypothetical protein